MRRVLTIFLLSILYSSLLSPQEAWAQESDFFSNTQTSGLLPPPPAGTTGCPTGADCTQANAPGFNPANLVRHADPGATISGFPAAGPDALTGPVLTTFFSQLGPGAITDNMFGIISTVLADATICGDLPPPAPADQNTGLGVPPDSAGPNGSSLNCGDLRFDPTSQSQTIPTFPASNNITSASDDVTFINDFNPSTDDHIGFNLTNNLMFNATQTSNAQQMRQVTALTAGGTAAAVGSPGTEASPGTGDQALQINTSWPLTLQSSFTSITPTAIITWSMSLDDLDPLTPNTAPFPIDQTDLINTMGTLDMGRTPSPPATFPYNVGVFPTTIIPAPCWWAGCTVPTETITIP